MPRYLKRPVIVEAYEFEGVEKFFAPMDLARPLGSMPPAWLVEGLVGCGVIVFSDHIEVRDRDGYMQSAQVGDFVVQQPGGHLVAYDRETFLRLFQPLEED